MPEATKILIADDEEQIRDLLRITLSTQGYEGLPAANGQEAVINFKKNPTDIILMDLNMPQLDGCEAIRRIRGLDEGKSVPIVVLTALDTPEWEEKARDAGANLFLGKPFRPKDIIHCVRTLLDSFPNSSSALKRSQRDETPSKEFNIKVRYKTNDGFLNCYLKNLLEGRSFVETKKLLPLGSRFNFEIILPDESDPFLVYGTVKWINLYEEQRGMGIQFDFNNIEEEKRIHKWVMEMESRG